MVHPKPFKYHGFRLHLSFYVSNYFSFCLTLEFNSWIWFLLESNQSILKEISPKYSLEGLILKLNSSTFTTWCKELIGKDPDAGKGWRQKGMTEDVLVGWHHWLDGHEFWVSFRSWLWTGKPGVLQSMGSQKVGPEGLNWSLADWGIK